MGDTDITNKTCFIPETSCANNNLPGLKTGFNNNKEDGMYEVLLLQEKVVLQVIILSIIRLSIYLLFNPS